MNEEEEKIKVVFLIVSHFFRSSTKLVQVSIRKKIFCSKL